MWDASKKDWVPAKGKPAAHAAARVPDPAAPVNRDAEGYQTSVLPTLRSEDELAAYQKDLVAKAKVQRYVLRICSSSAFVAWAFSSLAGMSVSRGNECAGGCKWLAL